MTENYLGLADKRHNMLLEKGSRWEAPKGEGDNFSCLFFNANDIETEDFLFLEHRVVFDAWKNASKSGKIPETDTLDPFTMVKALGYILVLEPVYRNGEIDFLYRLYGSKIATRFGKDMSGKYLSDFTTTPSIAFTAQYRELLKRGTPFYSENNAPPEISNITRWCRLALPYGQTLDNDERHIERLLVCNFPMNQKNYT